MRSISSIMTKTIHGRFAAQALVGCLALTLSACFPDNVTVYEGPLQVEFRPTSATLNLANSESYSAIVQLIGPHQNRPISIDFVVDDASTAVEGVHYTIGSTTAQIPANSSFAEIVINAIPGGFEGGSRTVVVTLLGSTQDEVVPAVNYRTLTLQINP